MSPKVNSKQFSAFFNSYHNLENDWHRVCIDSILCYLAKNPKCSDYKWELNTLDKFETLQIYHVLCILQPNLSMKYMVNKSNIILSWSGKFNVPSKYFYENSSEIKYAPVIRQSNVKGSQKSTLPKNPWSGRLRRIERVDYNEEI
jgi:hypothetical protein